MALRKVTSTPGTEVKKLNADNRVGLRVRCVNVYCVLLRINYHGLRNHIVT